ncbi:MAG: hypothetical protein LQ343_007356 [Gyalolechia ehrenbergii]|nr:MAG: hypothetical protein LQ343_007356 [Gyalolechia ehrenbergii]
MQAYAEGKRIALIQLGGRPTRPIQRDAGDWTCTEGTDDSSSGEEDDKQRDSRWLIDHWAHEGSKFAQELHAWQSFRRFQQHVRTKPVPMRERRVDDYWNERAIREALKPQLYNDLEQESKVNEWKEYYWYQHRQLHAYEKKITEGEREKERWLQDYDAAALQTSCNDKTVGTAWLHGRWQSRENIIEIGDCLIRRATRDRNKHASMLEWIEGQLPLIISEQLTRQPRASTNHSKPLLSRVRNSKVSKASTNRLRPKAQPDPTTYSWACLDGNRSQEHKQRDTLYDNKAPKPASGPAHNRLTRSSGVSKSAKTRTPTTPKNLKELSRSSGSARRREKSVGCQGVQIQLPPLKMRTLRRSKRVARRCSGGDRATGLDRQ